MRIDLHPRFRQRVEKLNATDRKQVAKSLDALANEFGRPHGHAGLGIRRLRKDLFECRAGLHWRVIIFAEKGSLTAYDVMTHSEIRAWLRSL